jgi:membrane-associated protein
LRNAGYRALQSLTTLLISFTFTAMEQLFHLAIEFIKNLGNPDYVYQLIKEYNTLFYAVFFIIIFIETGLIVWPLLPGDSLLFIVGAAIAATGSLQMEIVIPLLIFAALLGDNVNYLVGKIFGEQIKKRERILFFKREYLTQTHEFYEKHGGKTVIMARFIPIVRTIAPFVAGAGTMKYSRYIVFCVIGAVLWVGGVTSLGYLFGGIEIVKHNFEKVILGIIFISVLPVLWQFAKPKLAAKKL